jgi:peptidoglycan/xylan/chitin deacetylase (PgdA/CDA1 family)
MIRLKNIFSKHRVLVLMYHRIADISIDPWDLAVSASNFKQHLQVVKPHIISLPELIQQLQKGYLSRSGYCITFDDGYKDNYVNAVPLLNEFVCPATFFITSGFTGSRQMFWWDILTEIFLKTPRLPGVLDMRIGDHTISYLS